MVLLLFWFLIIRFGTSIWDSEIRYQVDEIANDLRTITFWIRFFFDSYTETYDFWSSWNRERFANDHFFDTIFLDSYTEMYDFCEMFARCILDPHLLFFFECFGGANLFSIFDSCTETYDFSEMFARCILDPYLLCFEFSVLQICSILKSIHVSVLSEAFSS